MSSESDGDRGVIVGVDGSEGSRHALTWAVQKVDRLGLVKAMTTFVAGAFADGFGSYTGVLPGGQPYRDEAHARMAAVLEAVDPSLVESAEVIEHWAGPGLVGASKGAGLLVVGSRGRGALAETLLGSVSSYCVKHAKVPVAVIPDHVPTDGELSTIVVGVDGSKNAGAALLWATEHVEPGGKVIAVGAFSTAGVEAEAFAEYPERLESWTRKLVEETVSEYRRDHEDSPAIEIMIKAGDPRLVLQDVGRDADLLVVGSRGHRAVAYLLLGSVATALIHHPTVATVVVPGR